MCKCWFRLNEDVLFGTTAGNNYSTAWHLEKPHLMNTVLPAFTEHHCVVITLTFFLQGLNVVITAAQPGVMDLDLVFSGVQLGA